MTSLICISAIPAATLIQYWLAELDDAATAQIEEHLFACAECSGRLRGIVQLARSIQDVTRTGNLHAVLSADFVDRLRDSGLRVREYCLDPGGSVMCTVTREDDLVISRLRAPLRDVRRLDVLVQDLGAGQQWRLEDVAFDPTQGEVVLAPNTTLLRQLPVTTQRMELIAIDETGERRIGDYTFNHSPS